MSHWHIVYIRVAGGSLKAGGLGDGGTSATDRPPFPRKTIPKLRLRLPPGGSWRLTRPLGASDLFENGHDAETFDRFHVRLVLGEVRPADMVRENHHA